MADDRTPTGGAVGDHQLKAVRSAPTLPADGHPGSGGSDAGLEIVRAITRSHGAVVTGQWDLEDEVLLDQLLEERLADWHLLRIRVFEGDTEPLVERFSEEGGVSPLGDFVEELRAAARHALVLVRVLPTRAPQEAVITVLADLAAVPGVRFIVGEPTLEAGVALACAERWGGRVVRVHAPTPRECERLAELILGGPCTREVVARVWSAGAGRRAVMAAVLRDGLDDGVFVPSEGAWACARPFAAPGERQLAAMGAVLGGLGRGAEDAVDLCALGEGLSAVELSGLVGADAVDEAVDARCLRWRGSARRILEVGGLLAGEAVLHRMPHGRAAQLLEMAEDGGLLAGLPARVRCRWLGLAGRDPGPALRAEAVLDAATVGRCEDVEALGRSDPSHRQLGADQEPGREREEQIILALGLAVSGREAAARALSQRHGLEAAGAPSVGLDVELLGVLLAAPTSSPLQLQHSLASLRARVRDGNEPTGVLGPLAESWVERAALSLALRWGVSYLDGRSGTESGAARAGGSAPPAWEESAPLMARLLAGEVTGALAALGDIADEEQAGGTVGRGSGLALQLRCGGLLISGDLVSARHAVTGHEQDPAWPSAPQGAEELWPLLASLESGDPTGSFDLERGLGLRVSQGLLVADGDDLAPATAALAVVCARAHDPARARRWLEAAEGAPRPSSWWATQHAGVLRAWAQRLLGLREQARDTITSLMAAEDVRETATTRFMVLCEAVRAGHREWWDEALACAATVDSPLAQALLAAQAARIEGDPRRAALAAAALLRLGQAEFVEALRGRPAQSASVRREAWADVRLTPRQMEISRKAAEGQHSAGIAEDLGITKRTVESHLQQIYARLGVHSRSELRAWLDSHPGDPGPTT